jgi:hypothetical protein
MDVDSVMKAFALTEKEDAKQALWDASSTPTMDAVWNANHPSSNLSTTTANQ